MSNNKFKQDAIQGEIAEKRLQSLAESIDWTAVKVPDWYGWDLTLTRPGGKRHKIEVKWANDLKHEYNFALEVTNANDDKNFMMKNIDKIDYIAYLSASRDVWYLYPSDYIKTFTKKYYHTRRLNKHSTAHCLLLPKDEASMTFKA